MQIKTELFSTMIQNATFLDHCVGTMISNSKSFPSFLRENIFTLTNYEITKVWFRNFDGIQKIFPIFADLDVYL